MQFSTYNTVHVGTILLNCFVSNICAQQQSCHKSVYKAYWYYKRIHSLYSVTVFQPVVISNFMLYSKTTLTNI